MAFHYSAIQLQEKAIFNFMSQLDISQAKSKLANLLDLSIKGEEIIITQNQQPIAKISPTKKPLKRGSAMGKVWMSKDFERGRQRLPPQSLAKRDDGATRRLNLFQHTQVSLDELLMNLCRTLMNI